MFSVYLHGFLDIIIKTYDILLFIGDLKKLNYLKNHQYFLKDLSV